MTSIIIFLLLIMALFAVAFITKRRYGMLALGLSAGAMLSTLWAGDITPLVAQAGLVLVAPPLESVVAGALVLLPAILLLLSGPTYDKESRRFMGALLFAVFATVLLLEPLGSALVIEGLGKQVFDFLTTNRTLVITVCLTIAVFDVLLTKIPKIPAKH